jgi:multidrug efflux system membrane fusion protein
MPEPAVDLRDVKIRPRPVTQKHIQHSLWWLWILLSLLILAGIGYWIYSRHVAAQNAGKNDAPRAVPVVAAKAHNANVPIYLTGLGSVMPLNTVTMHTRVDGELDSVNFAEGQMVHVGDLLAEIDPRPFQVQLTQAQGQMAKDQAALKNAQVELERDQAAADAIPKQTLDTQAALVDQDAAAIKIDQGQIDNAQLQLTYCHITSPLTGRIGLRLVDKGNIVHATDVNGLAVITQLQPIAIIFNISEDDVPQVMKKPKRGEGLAVDIFDRNLTTKLAGGTLLAVDNQVDSGTGTVRLKALSANENYALFPNQFVNARLLIDTIQNAVVAPTAAIQRGPDSTFVYVVKGDDTVEVRNITTGVSEGEQTVVQTGLESGEIVVTDGVDKLQAGSKVSVKQAGTTQPSTQRSTTSASE